MKTIKLILATLLMMVAFTVQAQERVVQVYKDGKVVKEYPASEVKSVEVKPYVDRKVYSDAACTKLLTEASSKVQPKGSVTVGATWDDSKATTMTTNEIDMKIEFKLYFNNNGKIAAYPVASKLDSGSWYVTNILNKPLIIEALQ